MPRKAPFNVIFASSEDEKFRASELDEHGPTVKGWQSHRYCQFPQEIIFRLHYPISLTQVQILAHQYLIPRKLELWLGPEEHEETEDVSDLNFGYIGYITLSDNKKSSYKSRELKSISVPDCKPTTYVKLMLESNHENAHNKYNQVSLVAVQLLGECKTGLKEPSPFDDLSFEMYVDKEVSNIIRQMEAKKEEAVKAERFRYAGKLKSAMVALREVGERLGRYEVSKQQAIANEDYSRANRKKEQMDLLRSEAYATLNINDLLEEEGIMTKNDAAGNEIFEASTPSEEADTPEVCPDNIPPPGVYQSPLSPLRYTSPPVSTRSQATIVQPMRTGSLRKKKQPRTSYDQYDDRIIPAAQRSINEEKAVVVHSAALKMNEREKKQAALPISVFGISLVEKFYSRQYSDKEEGVRTLESVLRNGGLEGNKIARGAVFLLHRALRDKVFSVYSMAASAVEYFFNSFISSRVSVSEMSRSVEKILPELLSKSGDVTPRIHNTAVHTILSMAHAPELRKLNLIPVHITRPLTSSTHPRLALSRLEIAEQLILSIGISTDKNSGMTARVLAEFGASGLHHPAEAVRKVAERVLVLVYRVNPRMVRKQLPPDDDITRRNLLYRQLMREFDKIDLQMQEAKKDTPVQNNKKLMRSGSISEPQEKYADKMTMKCSTSCYSANRIPSPVSPPSSESRDKQCIFCFRTSDSFTEEGLNIHYWKYCPMLTRCTSCSEVVEIPSLNSHVESGCRKSGDRENSGETRCPFCRMLVDNTDAGWRKHLVDGRICSNHPRAAFIHRSTPPLPDSFE
nr:centrosomal protein of 104 kDa-like [Halyomorpha halys]XP_024219115.1 centrosomal protein of 104 kDa-like isoform X2 [Halyomorpha halys]